MAKLKANYKFIQSKITPEEAAKATAMIVAQAIGQMTRQPVNVESIKFMHQHSKNVFLDHASMIDAISKFDKFTQMKNGTLVRFHEDVEQKKSVELKVSE